MAALAIELKISPDEVLKMDERMFKAVLQVLQDRAREAKSGNRSNKRRG